MLPHAALFPGHLHMHRPGSSHPAPGVRTGRLGVLSSLFSSGRGGSFPLFEVRHAALDVLLPVVRLPVPQHGLDAWPLIGQPLAATVPSTLSQWLSVSFFGLRLRGRWLATVLPSRLSRCVGVRLRHGFLAMVVQLSRMSCAMPDSSILPSNCATRPFKYRPSGGTKVSVSRDRTGVTRYAPATALKH